MLVADHLSREGHVSDGLEWEDLEWKSRYQDEEDGMKPTSEMLKDVSYNANDFGQTCDAALRQSLLVAEAACCRGCRSTMYYRFAVLKTKSE